MSENANDIFLVMLLMFSLFFLWRYKKENDREIEENRKHKAEFEAIIRDYKLSRDIISRRNVHLQEKLDDSFSNSTVSFLEENLEEARRYKVYKIVIINDISDNDYPRSAVVIAESENDAIRAFCEYTPRGLDYETIGRLYRVREVDRNQESVVLVNMDII